MTIEIIPAILTKSKAAFKRKLQLIEGVASVVQVDIMDGRLVPNTTWHDASEVAAWKFDLQYELHLMVEDPIPEIEKWKSVRGLQRAIIHAEAPIRLKKALDWIQAHKLEAGLAISPGTTLASVERELKRVDMALVMGGKPGFSGQKFDPKRLDLVRQIRKRHSKLPIGFDIGVNARTAAALVEAGVTRLNAASAIFKCRSPKHAYAALKKAAEGAARSVDR